MAAPDLEQFLRERVQELDPTRDTSVGSEVDRVLIQPLLARLGTDPFSVDARAFLLDMLNQRFPDMPTGDQDAIAEYLILPTEIVLQAVQREITRLRLNQSLAQPTLMNLEEAEQLGGNFFVERPRGDFARVRARIYYAQPRSVRTTAAHVYLTGSNLGFVPVTDQSISADQMLFNTENGLYFFDVNLIATQVGDQYNIEPNEIVEIQGMEGYVRVTNKGRGRNGLAESTAEEYVDQIRRSLGEQSLVTNPGVVAELQRAFPEMTRIATVGADDPRMQRDILTAASLGPLLFAGTSLSALADGEGLNTVRRISIDTGVDLGVDFTAYTGKGTLVLTVFGSFAAGRAMDIPVRSILSASSLELEESKIPYGAADLTWSLRSRELKLSRVPGGILLPDETGLATVPADSTHVGGMFDVYARGASLSDVALVLTDVRDDAPILQGKELAGSGGLVQLTDLVLGVNYQPGDSTYLALQEAVAERYVLELEPGTASEGLYDILSVQQQLGASPVVQLYTLLPFDETSADWRLLDKINVSLTDPKVTRHRGSDLQTVQGSDVVATATLLDFLALQVEPGDTLRILDGVDSEDDFVVQELLAPANSALRLDRRLTRTAQVRYEIFKPNPGGAIALPLVRLSEVQVLDSSGQPTGAKVPYAGMVGAHVLSLTNAGLGEKLEVPDALLGIITQRLPAGASVVGKELILRVEGSGTYSVIFTGSNPLTVSQIASQINVATGLTLAVVVDRRVGIYPYGGLVEVVGGSIAGTSAVPALFGGMTYVSSRMVRSPSFTSTTFTQLNPPLAARYDAVDVRSGTQPGASGVVLANPHPTATGFAPPPGLTLPTCILTDRDYFPAADVRLALGSRSQGILRCRFIDPTTVEVTDKTRFIYEQNGALLEYKPDPSMVSTLIPPAPYGTLPKDGNAVASSDVLSASYDFIKKKIRAGDQVVVEFKPLVGTVALADEVLNLANTMLIVSFGQETAKTITFVHDDDSIASTSVTRQGVADQINTAIGAQVAKIDSSNRLELYPEFLILVKAGGTANVLLGFSAVSDQNNRSSNAGIYTVVTPTNTGANVVPLFPATETRFTYKVVRPGSQRIGTTSMALQVGEGGLYFFDVEVVSLGTGNAYNLPAGAPLRPEGYLSDGYLLKPKDPNLSYSTEEEVEMILSRSVNNNGTNDDPEEATQLQGRSLSLAGQGSDLIAQIQTTLLSDASRDICANPLARCLLPHFVRSDVRYVGGPRPEVLQTQLSSEVEALQPEDALEASRISQIVRESGATSVENPLTLCVLVHQQDRRVVLQLSQDRVNVQGLAAYYPDMWRLTRSAI
jgi:hypothetical protein